MGLDKTEQPTTINAHEICRRNIKVSRSESKMVKNKITVYHIYQDRYNPTVQTIIDDTDYATRFALFSALIDKGINFKIEITSSEEP